VQDDDSKKIFRENLLKIAQILLDNHCEPNQLNGKAQSPLMIALENGNSFLVDIFMHQANVSITADISDDGKTVLHYFAMNSDQYELTEAFVQMVSRGVDVGYSQFIDHF
jgi:ankyrin repeat protein